MTVNFLISKLAKGEKWIFTFLELVNYYILNFLYLNYLDPATATPLENNFEQQKTIDSAFGEEQKVYVRRPTSTSLTTIVTDSGLSGEVKSEDSMKKGKWTSTKHSEPSASTPLLEDDNDSAYHDLIPYTGVIILNSLCLKKQLI